MHSSNYKQSLELLMVPSFADSYFLITLLEPSSRSFSMQINSFTQDSRVNATFMFIFVHLVCFLPRVRAVKRDEGLYPILVTCFFCKIIGNFNFVKLKSAVSPKKKYNATIWQ